MMRLRFGERRGVEEEVGPKRRAGEPNVVDRDGGAIEERDAGFAARSGELKPHGSRTIRAGLSYNPTHFHQQRHPVNVNATSCSAGTKA